MERANLPRLVIRPSPSFGCRHAPANSVAAGCERRVGRHTRIYAPDRAVISRLAQCEIRNAQTVIVRSLDGAIDLIQGRFPAGHATGGTGCAPSPNRSPTPRPEPSTPQRSRADATTTVEVNANTTIVLAPGAHRGARSTGRGALDRGLQAERIGATGGAERGLHRHGTWLVSVAAGATGSHRRHRSHGCENQGQGLVHRSSFSSLLDSKSIIQVIQVIRYLPLSSSRCHDYGVNQKTRSGGSLRERRRVVIAS